MWLYVCMFVYKEYCFVGFAILFSGSTQRVFFYNFFFLNMILNSGISRLARGPNPVDCLILYTPRAKNGLHF